MTFAIRRFTQRLAPCILLLCGAWATVNTAVAQVPLSKMNFQATKDGVTYTPTIVGANPFGPPQGPTPVHIVVIPTRILIPPVMFDATVPDPCGFLAGIAPKDQFHLSPLAQPVPNLTFNGVDVGNVQYPNGFRRAEFWSVIPPSYQTPITYTDAPPVVIEVAGGGGGQNPGLVVGSGCSQFGIVSNQWLQDKIEGQVIPSLLNSGVINGSDIALFLFRNVIQSPGPPPAVFSPGSLKIFGYHTAITGGAVQIYITADWDSTGIWPPNSATASHEIVETLDDPLVHNSAPTWGSIGQVTKCASLWEGGDTISAFNVTPIVLNGKIFFVQELGSSIWRICCHGECR